MGIGNPDSTKQFLQGMKNIERAIVEGVHAAEIHIDAANFRWNHGAPFMPPPEAMALEVVAQGRTANAILSREQLEDSYKRIERADVVLAVKIIVRKLSDKAAAPQV